MTITILNHFRLTWRLMKDSRVRIWYKVLFLAIPATYAAIPFAFEIPDLIPVVGLVDDVLLLVVGSLIFNAVSPTDVVLQHRQALNGIGAINQMNMEMFRHRDELRSLGIGLLVSVAALILSGMAAGIFWIFLFGIGYINTGMQRARYLANAVEVSASQLPELYNVFQVAQVGLTPVKVNLLVTQNPVMNAFTFGLKEPYTLVLTSALVENLTLDEIQAVIGHELGHIHFNHVLLISIMGASVTRIERLLFYKWSRSCEYSADAIALYTSGNDPRPMISALLKIASGLKNVNMDLDLFLAQVENGDKGKVSNAAELLSTHPFIHHRIQKLIEMSRNHQVSDLSLASTPILNA